MQQHELLGWKVKDKVTGFVGVVTHIGLDLYGCVQAIVHPEVVTEKNGSQKKEDGLWFDTARLDKIGRKRVMEPIPQKGITLPAGGDNSKPTK